MIKPLVLNLVAGPGAGKSTTAAGVFSKLKLRGVNCELVTEYAKDKVWEESYRVLEDQIYVLGKQHHRLFRLKDKVDAIITDSPVFLSAYYGTDTTILFDEFVAETYASYNNITVFLERQKHYNPAGRMQSEEEAREIDRELKDLMERLHISYITRPGNEDTILELTGLMKMRVDAINGVI